LIQVWGRFESFLEPARLPIKLPTLIRALAQMLVDILCKRSRIPDIGGWSFQQGGQLRLTLFDGPASAILYVKPQQILAKWGQPLAYYLNSITERGFHDFLASTLLIPSRARSTGREFGVIKRPRRRTKCKLRIRREITVPNFPPRNLVCRRLSFLVLTKGVSQAAFCPIRPARTTYKTATTGN
jgi:hypothetical protein